MSQMWLFYGWWLCERYPPMWKIIKNESCISCGDDVEADTTATGEYFYDGDNCRCVGCGEKGHISCDEDSFAIEWWCEDES